MHRAERPESIFAAALLLPVSGEARGGAQFPRFTLLATGCRDGPKEVFLNRDVLPQQLGGYARPFRFNGFSSSLKPLIVFLYQRKRFVQGYARFNKFRRPKATVRQQAQVIRERQFGARASVGFKALLQQPKPLLQSALQQQASGGVERARGVPE